MAVEFGGDFVVLLVGFLSEDRHWGGVRIEEAFFRQFGVGLAVPGPALAESFLTEAADSGPDYKVRG